MKKLNLLLKKKKIVCGRQSDHGSLSINWKETRSVEPANKKKKNEKQNPGSPEEEVETHTTSPPPQLPLPLPPPTTTKEMGNHNLATLMSIFVVVLMMVTSVAKAQTTATCASKLAPCATYLNSTNPPASCCNPIKETVSTDLPCLCGLYTNPAVLKSFNITVDQALNLTRACGVSTDVSKCNGIFLPFFFFWTWTSLIEKLLGLFHLLHISLKK